MESAYRTPKGLVWLDERGPNRHAANAALIALQSSLVFPDHAATYETFAKSQINYMLGDSGRSFVVGFGINPPQRPYHRGRLVPSLSLSQSLLCQTLKPVLMPFSLILRYVAFLSE